MELPNLKELKAIFKLCRAQGVTEFNCPAIQVKFGDLPYEIKGGERVPVDDKEEEVAPSDEQLAYWSAQPDPLAQMETGSEQ